MKKLVINPESTEILCEMIGYDKLHSCYGFEVYYNWLVKQLNCDSLDDLVFLWVQPEAEAEDEEGWNLESFFIGIPFEKELIHSDLNYEVQNDELKNFGVSIGDVYRITANGKTLYADCNYSPFGVYINKKDLW